MSYGRNTHRLEGIPEGLPDNWSSRRPSGVPPPLFILYCLRVRVGLCALVTGEDNTVIAKRKIISNMNGKRLCLYMTTMYTAQQRKDERRIIRGSEDNKCFYSIIRRLSS